MKKWKFSIKPPKGLNPHWRGHAIRDNAEKLMDVVVKASKMDKYQIQQGRSKCKGTGYVLDPIDIRSEESEPTENAFLTMVDVDYYVNMNYYLSWFKPIIMYSFVPNGVGNAGKEYHYEVKNDEIHYHSPEGYVCHHKIWKYPADYVWSRIPWSIFHPFESLGITWYRVKRLSFPDERQVILLCPWFKIPWYLLPASELIQRDGSELTRYKYVHDQWRAIKYWGLMKDVPTLFVNFNRNDSPSLPVTYEWNRVCQAADSYAIVGGTHVMLHTATVITGDSLPFNLQGFAAFVSDLNPEIDVVQTGTFVTEVEEIPSKLKIIRKDDSLPGLKEHAAVCPLHGDHGDKSTVEGLQYVIGSTALDVKQRPACGVTPVAGDPFLTRNKIKSPIRDNPMKDVAIERRVIEVQSQAEQRVKPLEWHMPHFKKFVDLMDKIEVLKVDPISMEAAMSRVPAKNRLNTIKGLCDIPSPKAKSKGFVKGESYFGLKHPRLISPLEQEVQSRMYRFTYALQDALHSQPWFAFSKPPPKLASCIKRLSELAMMNKMVMIETDFSRYDGTVTKTMRVLERMLYARAFGESSEIISLLDKTFDVEFKIKGKKYKSGGSRCSGAPDTCLMNSILNLYMFYLALGEKVLTQVILGGDDGIAAIDRSEVKIVETAAADCGFNLKCQVREIAEPFIFLSRVFTWGSEQSCCDVVRAVSKIHITNHGGFPVKYHAARYFEKLTTLQMSDGNTPVLGDFLAHELERITHDPASHLVIPKSLKERNWREIVWVGDNNWPNQKESWMETYVRNRLKLHDGKLELIE
jgi:hypothetical protein